MQGGMDEIERENSLGSGGMARQHAVEHNEITRQVKKETGIPRMANGLLLASGSRKRSRRMSVDGLHRRIHSEPFIAGDLATDHLNVDDFFPSMIFDDELQSEDNSDWIRAMELSSVVDSPQRHSSQPGLDMDPSVVFCDEISEADDEDDDDNDDNDDNDNDDDQGGAEAEDIVMLDQFAQLNGFTPPLNNGSATRKHFVPPPSNEILKTRPKYHRRVVTDDTVQFTAEVVSKASPRPYIPTSVNATSPGQNKLLTATVQQPNQFLGPYLTTRPAQSPIVAISTSTQQDTAASSTSSMTTDQSASVHSMKDRGRYRCGRCGQVKVNHICPFEFSTLRTCETQTEHRLVLNEKTIWRTIKQSQPNDLTVNEIAFESVTPLVVASSSGSLSMNTTNNNNASASAWRQHDRVILARRYVPYASSVETGQQQDIETTGSTASAMPPLNRQQQNETIPHTATTTTASTNASDQRFMLQAQDSSETLPGDDELSMDIYRVLSQPSPPPNSNKDERKRLLSTGDTKPTNLMIPDPSCPSIPAEQVQTPGTPPKTSFAEPPPPPADTTKASQLSPIRRAQSSPGILHRPEKVQRSESCSSVTTTTNSIRGPSQQQQQQQRPSSAKTDRRLQPQGLPAVVVARGLAGIPQGVNLNEIMPPPPLPEKRPPLLPDRTAGLPRTASSSLPLDQQRKRPASFSGLPAMPPAVPPQFMRTGGQRAASGLNFFPPGAPVFLDPVAFAQLSDEKKQSLIFASMPPPPPPPPPPPALGGGKPHQEGPTIHTRQHNTPAHAPNTTITSTTTDSQNQSGPLVPPQSSFAQFAMQQHQQHLRNASLMRTQSAPDFSGMPPPPVSEQAPPSSQQQQQQQQQQQRPAVVKSTPAATTPKTSPSSPFDCIWNLLPSMTPEQLHHLSIATSQMAIEQQQQQQNTSPTASTRLFSQQQHTATTTSLSSISNTGSVNTITTALSNNVATASQQQQQQQQQQHRPNSSAAL